MERVATLAPMTPATHVFLSQTTVYTDHEFFVQEVGSMKGGMLQTPWKVQMMLYHMQSLRARGAADISLLIHCAAVNALEQAIARHEREHEMRYMLDLIAVTTIPLYLLCD